ncbi:hypothetical protein Scel_84220 [Streptomyces cellostaticus]|nr:hypothetical protein Scel_84220 [Streptomyces cellostaticus]
MTKIPSGINWVMCLPSCSYPESGWPKALADGLYTDELGDPCPAQCRAIHAISDCVSEKTRSFTKQANNAWCMNSATCAVEPEGPWSEPEAPDPKVAIGSSGNLGRYVRMRSYRSMRPCAARCSGLTAAASTPADGHRSTLGPVVKVLVTATR